MEEWRWRGMHKLRYGLGVRSPPDVWMPPEELQRKARSWGWKPQDPPKKVGAILLDGLPLRECFSDV